MSEDGQQLIASIANEIITAIDNPTSTQRRILDRLRHHFERLSAVAFQLAVLGQFKRGKSTLLNALIGAPALSTSILPLTSVPTFVTGGPILSVKLARLDGEVVEQRFAEIEDLAAAVAAVTTEEQNPHNVKRIERACVTVPSDGWLNNVILIDTPGIGSTHAHNTDAAHRALSECDAALFVLSVDPPITEVETEYLAAICKTVSHVVIVLNKIDLVDDGDRNKVIQFLGNVLEQQSHAQIDPTIFPVSARAAIAAKANCDDNAWRGSGLYALEQYIRNELVGRRRAYLRVSIGKKILEILAELEDEATITIRALDLPMEALDDKIRTFEAAAAAFDRERDNLKDMQSGDWKRALAKLDALCEESEKRAHDALEGCIAGLADGAVSAEGQALIASTMYRVFDGELHGIYDAVGSDLDRATDVHKARCAELVNRVRETAADLLDVKVRSYGFDDWFQSKREPYWIDQARVESLGSLTADGIAWLLPVPMRRAREMRKIRAAARDAVTRNISELRWTMRQNIDDSFRRLLSSSAEAIDANIQAMQDVLALARSRRQDEATDHEFLVQRERGLLKRLTMLREQLESILGDEVSAS